MKVFVIALHFENAMKTGCWHTYSGPGRVGVSRSVPRRIAAGYRRYLALAPGPWFSSVSETKYRRLYGEQLARLDPAAVWTDLNRLAAPCEPVLMCWERAGEFCHRRLIADWFEANLDMTVPEADPDLSMKPEPSQVVAQLSLF